MGVCVWGVFLACLTYSGLGMGCSGPAGKALGVSVFLRLSVGVEYATSEGVGSRLVGLVVECLGGFVRVRGRD